MPVEEEIVEYGLEPRTGFILAEEEALKHFLSGITILTPRGAPREVGVQYRWAAGERKIEYPYIMIDLLNIVPDPGRQTSVWNIGTDPSVFVDPLRTEEDGGTIRIGQYAPSTSPDSMPEIGNEESDIGYQQENPKPVKLIYQVTVFSRNALDDRMLMSKFYTDVFTPNPLFLSVAADHTWRRMELVSFMVADTQETTETDKQVRRKIYTISIEAEIPVESVTEVSKARMLHVDIYDRESLARESSTHLTTDPHEIALGSFTIPSP